MMENSLRKFHKDVDYHLVEGDELATHLRVDPQFFYRATPIIAEKYIKDYELVLKIDADSIITGSLDAVFNTVDYDIGTVINWNRVDPQQYGYVQGWGIQPPEYFNCGFVAMRSEAFIRHWKALCFSPQFDRMQYREQDLLNVLCYYGNYNVRCFDHPNSPELGYWYGLISKGEWNRAILKNDAIIVPKGEGDTPFPDRDMELKVLHFAGGAGATKMNYKIFFSDDVSERLDRLVANSK